MRLGDFVSSFYPNRKNVIIIESKWCISRAFNLYTFFETATVTTTLFLNDSRSVSGKFMPFIWCIIVKVRVIYSKVKHFSLNNIGGIYILMFSLFSFTTELSIAVSIFSTLSYDIESERSLHVSTSSFLLVILWRCYPSPAVKGVSFWFRNLAESPELDLYFNMSISLNNTHSFFT